MFIDTMRKQTHQSAQYKLKIIRKYDSRNTYSGKHVLVKKYKSGYLFCWHAISRV